MRTLVKLLQFLRYKLTPKGMVVTIGTLSFLVIVVWFYFAIAIFSLPTEEEVEIYSSHAHLVYSYNQLRKADAHMKTLISQIEKISGGRVDATEIATVLLENCDDEITSDLVIRLANRESKWRPNARGGAGEIGLMQLKPSSVKVPAEMLFTPATNVFEGIKYLKRLRAEYGNFALGLAHYAEGYTAGKSYAKTLLLGLE